MAFQWQSNLPPFSTNGLTTEEVRIKIDEEISQMRERIMTLTIFRNSLAPISQLPTELLSTIFSHVRDGTFSQKPDEDAKLPFILTWVCRHWRGTALAIPYLWSIITNTNGTAKQIGITIKRSRNLPLYVNLSNPSATVFTVCLRHITRIRELRLIRSGWHAERPFMQGSKVRNFLLQRAPELTSLHFEGVNIPNPDLVLFSGDLPRLTSVLFHGCSLDLTSKVAGRSLLSGPTITQLHISEHDLLIDASSFDRILISLSNLQELQLTNTLIKDRTLRTIPRVSLPNLQTIKIVDTPIAMLTFLEWFNIPRCLIHLSFGSDFNEIWFCRVFQAYKRSMSFDFRYFEFRSDQDKPSPSNSDSDEPSSFTFNLSSDPLSHRYSFHFQFLEDRVGAVSDTLNAHATILSQVTNLSIIGFPYTALDPLFNLNDVKSLSALGSIDDSRAIVELLSLEAPDSDDSDEEDDQVWFKKLEKLTLDELDDDTYDLLLGALGVRLEMGLPKVELNVKGR